MQFDTHQSRQFLMTLLGFILQVVLHADAGYTTQCPARDDASAIRRLKSTIFCDYDLQERPVKNRTANVSVAVSIELNRISVMDMTNENQADIWITVVWHDEYLTWDPTQFDGISQIEVPVSQLWLPDLSIYNSGRLHQGVVDSGTARCVIDHWGRILCVPSVQTPLQCQHDASQWPYDTRNCSIYLGSWWHNGGQVDLQLYYEGFTMHNYKANPEWEISGVNLSRHVTIYPCCPDEPYVSLSYNINLKRHATLHSMVIVTPAFIVAGVSLSGFFIPRLTPRVVTCLAAMLANISFLLHLAQRIPADGDSRPSILTYYKDGVLMSMLALIVTVFTNWLDHCTSYSRWVSEKATWLRTRAGPPGHLLLGKEPPMENGGPHPSDDHHGSVKSSASAVLDRVCFIVFFITYGVMLTALLP